MKNASWKTTAGGIGSIFTGLGIIANALANGSSILGAITGNLDAVGFILTGVGLLFARDNNVSSEQAGAKVFADDGKEVRKATKIHGGRPV